MREKQCKTETGIEIDETGHNKKRKRKWFTELVLLLVLLAVPAIWLGYCWHNDSQLGSLRDHPGFQKETSGPIWFRRFADKWNLPVPKRAISFRGPHSTDEDMALVSKVRSLHTLILDHSPVTDAGLAHLTKLRNLEILSLCHTLVTDDGLTSLSGLTNLRHLNLTDTQVTDKGLRHLKSLRQLKTLFLRDTSVTPESVARLKAAIPGLDVRTY